MSDRDFSFSKSDQASIRVVSWNIHEGVPVVSRAADPVSEMATVLRDADLAALQEVALNSDAKFGAFASIAAGTSLEYHLSFPMSESAMFADRRMGVVLLSKWPLRDARLIKLPNPHLSIKSEGRVLESHDKGLLAARLAINGCDVWFATAHGFPFYLFQRDPREASFVEIWEQFAEALDSLGSLPLLVGADFNTEHRDLLTGRLVRAMSRSIIGTPTYRGIESDDIIFSAEFSLRKARVVPNFSDHDLCACDFDFTAS